MEKAKRIDKLKESKKLEKKRTKKEESLLKKNKSRILFITGTLVFLLIIFTLFVPTKTSYYEVEIPYNDTEYYIEKEPYQVEEPYQVKEPYQTTETYIDIVPVEKSVPYQTIEYVYYSDCDSTEGCTCIHWHWFWGYCDGCECKVTKYKTEIVYEEIEKTRPVTKYKDIIKYRTVTKYRNVTKSREVIKIKIEQREKEVNWLFGYRVPYKLPFPYINK